MDDNRLGRRRTRAVQEIRNQANTLSLTADTWHVPESIVQRKMDIICRIDEKERDMNFGDRGYVVIIVAAHDGRMGELLAALSAIPNQELAE